MHFGAVSVQYSFGVRIDRVEPHIGVLREHLDGAVLREDLPHSDSVNANQQAALLLDHIRYFTGLLLQHVRCRVLHYQNHQVLLPDEIDDHRRGDRIVVVGRIGIVAHANVELEGKLGRVHVVERHRRPDYAGGAVDSEVTGASSFKDLILQLAVLAVVFVVCLHLYDGGGELRGARNRREVPSPRKFLTCFRQDKFGLVVIYIQYLNLHLRSNAFPYQRLINLFYVFRIYFNLFISDVFVCVSGRDFIRIITRIRVF